MSVDTHVSGWRQRYFCSRKPGIAVPPDTNDTLSPDQARKKAMTYLANYSGGLAVTLVPANFEAIR